MSRGGIRLIDIETLRNYYKKDVVFVTEHAAEDIDKEEFEQEMFVSP